MQIVRGAPDGFTITELVVVIMITTILAAFAASRVNTQSFDTEGYANRAAAMVRYAQRIAISQRRNVLVEASGNTLRLCYSDTLCAAGCVTAVREPPGTNAFAYSPPSGVTIADASVCYSALGKPIAGAAFTVTGDGAKTITVAAETGYVQYVP
jgi:MSHA pilin protein MshC